MEILIYIQCKISLKVYFDTDNNHDEDGNVGFIRVIATDLGEGDDQANGKGLLLVDPSIEFDYVPVPEVFDSGQMIINGELVDVKRYDFTFYYKYVIGFMNSLIQS